MIWICRILNSLGLDRLGMFFFGVYAASPDRVQWPFWTAISLFLLSVLVSNYLINKGKYDCRY